MKILLMIGAAFLVGCTTPAMTDSEAQEFTHITFETTKATDAERADCEAAGGTVERRGRLGAEHCVQPYPDAGENCASTSDCLGRCELSEDLADPIPGTSAEGVCQATTSRFGCMTLVEGGKIEATLCID